MAFMYIITALAIVAAFATSTMAKDIVVGDDNGWKLNFDYQAWAQKKEFNVGDKLIFNYQKGAHNVYKVDGNGFKQCTYPDVLQKNILQGKKHNVKQQYLQTEAISKYIQKPAFSDFLMII